MLKISVISRVRSTSEITDIFKTRDEIFLVFTEKSKIYFHFFLKLSFSSILGEKLNFFPSHFLVNFAWLSAFSG